MSGVTLSRNNLDHGCPDRTVLCIASWLTSIWLERRPWLEELYNSMHLKTLGQTCTAGTGLTASVVVPSHPASCIFTMLQCWLSESDG